MTSIESLNTVDLQVRKDFEANRRILSFDEYIALVAENPERHLRGSAEYNRDMMDHFGKTEAGHGNFRFHLFDEPIDGIAPKVVGHEAVQTEIYQSLQSFIRLGSNHQLILLHGPNGSAKTTIAHALMNGLERYSRSAPGAIYSFNWVFPSEKLTKGGIGFQNAGRSKDSIPSYAHLADEEVAAKIPSDLRDHPILAIPSEYRYPFLEKLLGRERVTRLWDKMPSHLKMGDLNQRCRMIFDALLTSYEGDLKKVLRHIQVERFYFSRRYRQGLVTVEPQMHVDAHYQMLALNRNYSQLPASLQSLNLFTLTGDLVEGNRGMIEYSDLLKRPVDAFKYLLIACETGAVNVGSSIAYLDSVLIGSSNELQLDAFKEFPDFSSFKARIQLIRVPYLLSYSQEKEIFELLLPQITSGKEIAPHVAWTVALWSVLTRLKKPNSINFPPSVSSIVSGLTPLQKARLYDHEEVPQELSPDEKKLLRAHLTKLREEYRNVPFYEGRMGASVREIKAILFGAAQNPDFPCLSPLAVFHELEQFVKHLSEYEFLRQDVKDGYHDAADFIQVVRNEYLDLIDREVRDSLGFYDSNQWEDFIKKYVVQITALLKKEKIKNTVTGQMDPPDASLIQEFEKIVDAPTRDEDVENFRRNLLSQVGAWALDHANQPMEYSQVFPEFWKKLERHFFESKRSLMTKMSDALQGIANGIEDLNSDDAKLARQTLETLKVKYKYPEKAAIEVVSFLVKKRY